MRVNKDIVIFQAPMASLVDCGLLLQLHRENEDWEESIPAQYYSPVYVGPVELIVNDTDSFPGALLGAICARFNVDDRPNPRTSRALSIGDVIRMDGKYYLVTGSGYPEVKFQVPAEGDPSLPAPVSMDGLAAYLKKKYLINGKASTLLDNILNYNEIQGECYEAQQDFLEFMLSGLGISSEDRELIRVFCVCDDVLDYVRLEEETSEIWPWAATAEEIQANKEALQRIARELIKIEDVDGDYDTDTVYEKLTEEFGLASELQADTD